MNAMHVHKALLLDVLKVADVFKTIITTDKDKPVHLLSASGVKYKLNKTELQKSAEKLLHHPRVRPGTELLLYSSAKDLGREQLWARILQAAFPGEEEE